MDRRGDVILNNELINLITKIQRRTGFLIYHGKPADLSCQVCMVTIKVNDSTPALHTVRRSPVAKLSPRGDIRGIFVHMLARIINY